MNSAEKLCPHCHELRPRAGFFIGLRRDLRDEETWEWCGVCWHERVDPKTVRRGRRRTTRAQRNLKRGKQHCRECNRVRWVREGICLRCRRGALEK